MPILFKEINSSKSHVISCFCPLEPCVQREHLTLSKQITTTDGITKWVELDDKGLFEGKKVVIFGLPGAFTPTCSSQQLPGFEQAYNDFRQAGIDDIYCVTVNDSFVCNAWTANQALVNVKVIPDGSAQLTIKMGMDVRKDNIGFGVRSWRYAAVVDDGNIVQQFVEDGFGDDVEGDPYEVSSPENVLKYLQSSTLDSNAI